MSTKSGIDTEKIVLISILAISLALRLWDFYQVPILRSDELLEDIRGFEFYRGTVTLLNIAPFNGAYFNYLLGTAFFFCGLHPHLPRLLTSILGIFGVLMTYAFAKVVFNRKTAFLSAILLATNPGEILISSHVGWAHSLATPLIMMSLYFFSSALKKNKYWLLCGTALGLGLALQSHLVAVFTIATLILYLAMRRNLFSILRMKVTWIAVLIFLLAYGNMIYLLVTSETTPLESAMNRSAFDDILEEDYERYFVNLEYISRDYLRMTGTLIFERHMDEMIVNPDFTLYLILMSVSVLWGVYKHLDGHKIILIHQVLGILGLPLFLRYQPSLYPRPFMSNYIVYLLPNTFIMISSLVVGVSSRFTLIDLLKDLKEKRLKRSWRLFFSIFMVALLCYLTLSPVVRLYTYYQVSYENGWINGPLIETAMYMRSVTKPSDMILISEIMPSRRISHRILHKLIFLMTEESLGYAYILNYDLEKTVEELRIFEERYKTQDRYYIFTPMSRKDYSDEIHFLKTYPSIKPIKTIFGPNNEPFLNIYRIEKVILPSGS
ncbi:MAG: glycosyltransferase family 39 protein [Candidatus Bathyarchaeota archaeon]|nr:MAG: glycosyltransferase family 39 protein [Candidatus Bathyarchaeota archaeon]